MMESGSQPSAGVSEQHSGQEEEKSVDPTEDFSRQLEDIINTYGSASSLMEKKISILEKDEEKLDEETMHKDLDGNSGASNSPETGLGKKDHLSFSLYIL